VHLDLRGWKRRDFLRASGMLLAGAGAGWPLRLMAEELKALDVASAGAIAPMLRGPIKEAIAQALQLELRSHAQGADAVAKAIVDESLRADIFLPITAGPMLTVMRAGKAAAAKAIARTEMVLVYSPKSRFAARFEAAAEGKANWWEILQEPGFRFARSNPAGDPGGRNILFTMMLAAKKYHQADLVEKTLGAVLNPEQILQAGNNQERLHNGELDATASYKVGPGFEQLPYLALPSDVNLSGWKVHEEHPEVSLTVAGKTFYPEPLVFYAAVLNGAANAAGAAAFVDWLLGNEAQELLRHYAFDAAGDVPMLKA